MAEHRDNSSMYERVMPEVTFPLGRPTQFKPRVLEMGVKDLILNVEDKLLDAINYLENDQYVSEDMVGFTQLSDTYEQILKTYNSLKEFRESFK